MNFKRIKRKKEEETAERTNERTAFQKTGKKEKTQHIEHSEVVSLYVIKRVLSSIRKQQQHKQVIKKVRTTETTKIP